MFCFIFFAENVFYVFFHKGLLYFVKKISKFSKNIKLVAYSVYHKQIVD